MTGDQKIRKSDDQRIRKTRGGIQMLNMDQNKLMEVINHSIISKYTQNILLIKTVSIKLFSCFPHTGAPNISDAQNIAVLKDLKKFIEIICTNSSN
jgi:hypothetical protein